MSSAVVNTLTAACVLTLIWAIARGLSTSSRKQLVPPGPAPRFLIGNAPDIPHKNASRTYYGWSQMYNSSMIYLQAFGNRFIILHSREDADELLENRAKIYSSRLVTPTIELIGWDYNFALFPYNDRWRAHRRTAHQNLKLHTTEAFRSVQLKRVHDMLAGLLEAPGRFDDYSKMMSISIPLTTMFGYNVKSLDDPVIHAADQHMSIGGEVIGGSLVNIFPMMKYIPWTWTQRMSSRCRKMTKEMKRIPLEALLKSMAVGNALPSLVGTFMEKKQTVGASEEEEEMVMNVAHTVYGAASDTTISATRSFFYLMLAHPEVQAKARAELDRVLADTRLPTFEDRPSLPYIEAIYREVLRFCPSVPMGLGHVSTQDDWYKGYFIPKGTIVMANLWAIGLDEERFGQDVHAFNPDRFFDSDGKLNNEDRIVAYGFGKRVCVGKHVASATLWLAFASILACFTLSKKKDDHGNEIDVNHEFIEEGLFLHKAPHECDIKARSHEWKELVESLKTRDSGV